jgi:RNA polymerase sigma-70 factor (ECF subfamily)
MLEPEADPVAQERVLWARFAGRVRHYGLRHLRNSREADDLVQQVLLAVLEALRAGRVADVTTLERYVLGTCRQLVWDVHRGERRRRGLVERLPAPAPVEPDVGSAERFRLEQCFNRLPVRERSIVFMTFVEERTAGEIAEALSLSEGNVRVIRHRAMGRLQSCMEGRA